jgi:hypothetical protein
VTVTLIVILTTMLVAYLAFAYRYWRFSPWKATWQGVTLQSQKLTLAALVAFFIVDTAIPGQWPGRAAILIALLILLALEAWATFLGLLHVQRQDRPVSRRQGTGYVPPEDIEKTDPRRRSS